MECVVCGAQYWLVGAQLCNLVVVCLLIYMNLKVRPVVHSARWPDANGEDNIFTLFSFMRVNEVGGLIMGIEENRILKHILLIV